MAPVPSRQAMIFSTSLVESAGKVRAPAAGSKDYPCNPKEPNYNDTVYQSIITTKYHGKYLSTTTISAAFTVVGQTMKGNLPTSYMLGPICTESLGGHCCF